MKKEKLEQKLSLFSRRELREFTGWSEFQVRTHLERLESMEYIQRRSGRQGTLCKYQLLIDADETVKSWQVGLTDVKQLRQKNE